MLDVDFFALLTTFQLELAFVVVGKSVAATDWVEFLRAAWTFTRGQACPGMSEGEKL